MRVRVGLRMREMSPCQTAGVWPSPLSSLISGTTGRVIHHGCQRKGCNWLGVFGSDCMDQSEKSCLCVGVCVSRKLRWYWSHRQSCQWVGHIWLSLKAGSRDRHSSAGEDRRHVTYTYHIRFSLFSYINIWCSSCPSLILTCCPSELVVSDESVAFRVLAVVDIAVLGEHP